MDLDIHRGQLTYELLNTDTGELRRGRWSPATYAGMRRLLVELPPGLVDVALEATTGWCVVVEELQAAGMSAHLAEPAETRALRGPKRRAKTPGKSNVEPSPKPSPLVGGLTESRTPEPTRPPSCHGS